MIDALETAILSGDRQQVVQVLASASEEERAAALRPVMIRWLALNQTLNASQYCDFNLHSDDPEVVTKRGEFEAKMVFDRNPRQGDSASGLVQLAWFGLTDLKHCRQEPYILRFEKECAQILADRSPPWLDQWIKEVERTKAPYKITPVPTIYWVALYEQGFLQQLDRRFVGREDHRLGLTPAYAENREATQRIFRELPQVLEQVYDVPGDSEEWMRREEWEPIIDWLVEENLLDRKRIVTNALNAMLSTPFRRAHRQHCFYIVNAAIRPSNAESIAVLATCQPQWFALLADAQAATSSWALEQLLLLEKNDKLDGANAVLELPQIFHHKSKPLAKKAVSFLGRLAKKVSLRNDAVRGLTFALTHPAREVQVAAIKLLEKLLGDCDTETIEAIGRQRETIPPTLQKQLEERLPAAPVSAIASSATTCAAATKSSLGLGDRAARIQALPPEITQRFRLNEALAALESGKLAEPGTWRMTHIRVLDQCPRLAPIESLEELVRITSAAVETYDDPDLADRIVEAITRLRDDRPTHFSALTASLRDRVCQGNTLRPKQGITGNYACQALGRLIAAWLGGRLKLSFTTTRDSSEVTSSTEFPLAQLWWAISERLASNTAYPLLSAATHHGGWIDPRVWVQRLETLEGDQADILEQDLCRSMLRLAPDRRDEAWQLVVKDTCQLSARMKQLASFVLEPGKSLAAYHADDTWPLTVWIAAIRARDPWMDMADVLSSEQIAEVPTELWKLPDTWRPTNYQWQAIPVTRGDAKANRIESSPVRAEDRDSRETELTRLSEVHGDLQARIREQSTDIKEASRAFREVVLAEKEFFHQHGFLTAQLNYVRYAAAPSHFYASQAGEWPMKLDWYWSAATIALARHISCNGKPEEAYSQFLLPLLEVDRCVTPMAARALWIATASKDSGNQAMAIEIWLELIASDRCETQTLIDAWEDVSAGGWMKLNHLSEVLQQVAATGTLAAWRIAHLLTEFLVRQAKFPRDVDQVLIALNECHEKLGLAVTDTLHEKLSAIKSGKAMQSAQTLMARENQSSTDQADALIQVLDARLARAERNIL